MSRMSEQESLSHPSDEKEEYEGESIKLSLLKRRDFLEAQLPSIDELEADFFPSLSVCSSSCSHRHSPLDFLKKEEEVSL